MTMKSIDTYLTALRRGLGPLNDRDARDIVEEIRSHILDKASGQDGITADSVAATLAALGTPQELATHYVTDSLLRRAQASRSPLLVLDSLFRWAALSFAGVVVLVSSLIGYFLGGALVLCALLKPLHPRSAGLWALPDTSGSISFSLRLGFSAPPVDGREILGWWMVPLGLLFGSGLLLVTFRLGVWSIRKFWRPRPWQGIQS